MQVLALALLLAVPQSAAPGPDVTRVRVLGVMGTSLEIKVRGSDAAQLDAALDAAIAEIRRVEDVMTDWRPSPLMDLNAAAGSGPVQVEEELVRVIARGIEVGHATGGAFDISYAGAGRLWDFKADPPVVPTAEEIAAALARVDYKRIKVDPEAATVDLPKDMRIGLGGIAKGYGVDRAMVILRKHGIEHALVNAGGDLKALGKLTGDALWEIAIKHPRDRDRVLAVLPLSNTCVMTSGDYERFFEHEGRRYHHILDPRTGYPSTGCMSATVLGPDATTGDALATAMCVLGPEEGLRVIEALDRFEALLVGMDGEVHRSSGLR